MRRTNWVCVTVGRLEGACGMGKAKGAAQEVVWRAVETPRDNGII